MNVHPKASIPLSWKETAATEQIDDTHEILSESSDQEILSESRKDEMRLSGEAKKERLGQFVVACIVVNYISAGYILLPRGMLVDKKIRFLHDFVTWTHCQSLRCPSFR